MKLFTGGKREKFHSLPVCECLTDPIVPTTTQADFFLAYVSTKSPSNLSPNPSEVISAQKSHSAGPIIFWGVESLYISYIGPHARFWKPRTTLQYTPLFPPKMLLVPLAHALRLDQKP